jgi:quercetin dioxygenase-like cupin family protein
MHRRVAFDEGAFVTDPILGDHSQGYSLAPLVGADSGSPHQRVVMSQLQAGGSIEPHFHSFEEVVYVLAGTVELTLGDAVQELGPDDFALAQTGTPHSWRTAGSEPARWLEISAPQPKPPGSGFPDTFFEPRPAPNGASALVGHFDESQLPPLALAGFTAANVSNASLKMLVDTPFGAAHLNFFCVQYAPGGLIKEHDHAFEEAYFFLSGEVEATADGKTQILRAGDCFWTGVGCPHAFTNRSSEPVRWVETQVPQPPARDAARFTADWPTA